MAEMTTTMMAHEAMVSACLCSSPCASGLMIVDADGREPAVLTDHRRSRRSHPLPAQTLRARKLTFPLSLTRAEHPQVPVSPDRPLAQTSPVSATDFSLSRPSTSLRP